MLPRGNDEYPYGDSLSIWKHVHRPAMRPIEVRMVYLDVDNVVGIDTEDCYNLSAIYCLFLGMRLSPNR